MLPHSRVSSLFVPICYALPFQRKWLIMQLTMANFHVPTTIRVLYWWQAVGEAWNIFTVDCLLLPVISNWQTGHRSQVAAGSLFGHFNQDRRLRHWLNVKDHVIRQETGPRWACSVCDENSCCSNHVAGSQDQLIVVILLCNRPNSSSNTLTSGPFAELQLRSDQAAWTDVASVGPC